MNRALYNADRQYVPIDEPFFFFILYGVPILGHRADFFVDRVPLGVPWLYIVAQMFSM